MEALVYFIANCYYKYQLKVLNFYFLDMYPYGLIL